MFRAGGGDALGERELEEDLGDFLAKTGCSDELAKEQVGRLRRVRNFVAASKCFARRRRHRRGRAGKGNGLGRGRIMGCE